jgi:glycogen synthase
MNIAGNHQYHSEGILQEIVNITVKEYCRKSSISSRFTSFSLHRLQLQDGSFHRFGESSFGVNSNNLRVILLIHPWNVLQAVGSTPANNHL